MYLTIGTFFQPIINEYILSYLLMYYRYILFFP